MKDSEFLIEVEAKEKLEAKGYEKVGCLTCKGTGLNTAHPSVICFICKGKGYRWNAPITK